MLPQPLAIVEVGASAGLTLLPDKYSYDYYGHQVAGTDPRAPVLACQPRGPVPLPARVPEVAWRAGLDLNPLDVTSDDDVRWLQCLLWPGETGRQERLAAAVETARRDPPPLYRGDLLTDLPDLVRKAPRDATVVIYHSAVLGYVRQADRAEFAKTVGALGAVWLSNEGPGVLPGTAIPGCDPHGFVLAKDTVPIGLTESHGTGSNGFPELPARAPRRPSASSTWPTTGGSRRSPTSGRPPPSSRPAAPAWSNATEAGRLAAAPGRDHDDLMRVTSNGVELHVEVHGDGDPVLLLHGWPDDAGLWRNQVPALTGAGFRVITPDLRGFGRSARPAGQGRLPAGEFRRRRGSGPRSRRRARDRRVHVVGHDWGAAVAWLTAMYLPDRVRTLTALSVPHLAAPDTVRQREMAWYQLFFQFEEVAEATLRYDDWAALRELAPGYQDVDRAIANLSRPGALTASLNWYRANLAPRMPGPRPQLPPVKAPTLGIWSDGDRYLDGARMRASGGLVKGPWRYEEIKGATHWIPLDAPG